MLSHLISPPINLVDPIRMKYGRTSKLPPTKNTGSYPIDSIFVSNNLSNIIRGGWLEFGVGVSDHRILYVDSDMHVLLGRHKNKTSVRQIRRLQCNDPRTVQKFNERLEQHYRTLKMTEKLEAFHSNLTLSIISAKLNELHSIDRLNTQLVLNAEKKCRKSV